MLDRFFKKKLQVVLNSDGVVFKITWMIFHLEIKTNWKEALVIADNTNGHFAQRNNFAKCKERGRYESIYKNYQE